MIRFLCVLIAGLLIAAPAQAGPLAGAIAAVTGFATSVLGPTLGPAVVRILGGVALNALGRLLRGSPKARGGVTTEQTLAGGDNPETILAGWYFTAGSWVCPWLMHGNKNKFNTQVIDLSGVPSEALDTVYVNGAPVTLGETPHPDYGLPATGDYEGHLWVKFFDGSQTAADPFLLAAGGDDPDYPWTADMIGRGRTFVAVTYKYSRKVWKGVPRFKFALRGAAFYDMRRDSTAGGTGTHRLDDPATWEYTTNPVVMAAHIALGYLLPDGSIYGGDWTVDDLPLSVWAAQMNKADADFDTGDGLVPTWRAGAEIRLDREPAETIERLLATCDGEICDDGGTLLVRVGAPDLPVAFLTDDDLIVTQPENLDPFPGLNRTVNGIAITYPEPESGWEMTEAPKALDPALEAEDGGRRLMSSVRLPWCPYGDQVQRLALSALADARRFRVHVLNLPRDFAWVSPLATVSWTSARNGYGSKQFEVQEKATDLFSYDSQVTLREVDPADHDWQSDDLQPVTPAPPTAPASDDVALEDFAVAAVALSDGTADRRPGIRATWTDGPDAPVEIEVQLSADDSPVAQEVVGDGTRNTATLSQGLLPATAYRVRARVLADRPAAWSDWAAVTTGDHRLDLDDLTDVLSDRITDTETLAVQSAVDLELRETGEINAAHQIDRLAALLLSTDAMLAEMQGRIADAGIYVDPATGQVEIEALRRTEEYAASLQVQLDAATAQISQRVTVTEMNQAISELVLDPEQIPIIDELELRVTTAESEIDGLQGTITDKADTVTVNGINTRLVTAESEIDGLQGTITQKVDVADFTPLESRVTSAEQTLSGIDGATISQNVRDVRALTDELDQTTIQSLSDLLTAYESREALRVDLAYVQQDITARVNEDREATASALTALGGRIDDAQALIEEEESLRVSADSAIASDVTQLQTDLAGVQGDVSGNATAISGLDTRVTSAEGTISSQASAITSLSTTVGDNTTDITQTIASVDGIRGSYGVAVNANGIATGFGLVSDIVDGNPVGEFYIDADRFIVSDPTGTQSGIPFQVITTPTVIDGVTVPPGLYAQRAMFHEGIITQAMLQEAIIGSAQLAGEISSDNFVAGVEGWRITRAGEAEFLSLIDRSSLATNAATVRASDYGTSSVYVDWTANVDVSSPISADFVPYEGSGAGGGVPHDNPVRISASLSIEVQGNDSGQMRLMLFGRTSGGAWSEISTAHRTFVSWYPNSDEFQQQMTVFVIDANTSGTLPDFDEFKFVARGVGTQGACTVGTRSFFLEQLNR